MTSRLLFCILAVADTAGTTTGAQERPVQSDQQILIQLERDWDAAFLRNDVALIENILADEFVATYADGTTGDKARELRLVAAFNLQVHSSTLSDFTVKIYGDTAVVWFSRHLVGIRQGQPHEVTYRYTDVFVLRAGRWQCVSSQSTKVTRE